MLHAVLDISDHFCKSELQPAARDRRWTAPCRKWPRRRVVQAERVPFSLEKSFKSLERHRNSCRACFHFSSSPCQSQSLSFQTRFPMFLLYRKLCFERSLASLSFPAIPSTTSASSRRLSGPTITTSRDVAGMRVQYCLIANLPGTQKIKSFKTASCDLAATF